MNPAWWTVTGWSSRALVSCSLWVRCSLAISRLPSSSSTKSYWKKQTNTQNRFRQMQMIILMLVWLNQAVKRRESSKSLYFLLVDALYAAPLVISLTVWEELFKVVMQDTTRTGLCTRQIFEYNKCWFFSGSYLELIDVVWRVVCVLIELIWLWG